MVLVKIEAIKSTNDITGNAYCRRKKTVRSIKYGIR